ncbi:MAG TPA: acylphosphatase [Candidatus Hydrogenedentes bacterium]|jgi:acylphosphatase|nr:acylphosphatase [Candidatus Hydrogenedentota bacterium]HPJ99835.1 acylphosphatase [Candidatus Hydrogenedentota bacterium]
MTGRLRVHIQGRVQGVGFRYATYRQAVQRGLSGWVRNAVDGSVEAEFEGDSDALQTMLDWCRQGPVFAVVTSVDEQWESGAPLYDGFQIRS